MPSSLRGGMTSKASERSASCTCWTGPSRDETDDGWLIAAMRGFSVSSLIRSPRFHAHSQVMLPSQEEREVSKETDQRLSLLPSGLNRSGQRLRSDTHSPRQESALRSAGH